MRFLELQLHDIFFIRWVERISLKFVEELDEKRIDRGSCLYFAVYSTMFLIIFKNLSWIQFNELIWTNLQPQDTLWRKLCRKMLVINFYVKLLILDCWCPTISICFIYVEGLYYVHFEIVARAKRGFQIILV